MSPSPSRLSDRRSRARGGLAGRAAALVALCLVAVAGGCVVTETVTPDTGDGRAELRPLAARYEVRLDGELVGYVMLYGGSSESQSHYYTVTNPWGQEVGMVDGLGRAWRHRPHEERPEALGSAPLEEAVRRLLDLPAEPRLVAAPSAG